MSDEWVKNEVRKMGEEDCSIVQYCRWKGEVRLNGTKRTEIRVNKATELTIGGGRSYSRHSTERGVSSQGNSRSTVAECYINTGTIASGSAEVVCDENLVE